MSKCLVLLSGGQDSTTCLFWAKQRWDEVHTVSFDYGQRHREQERLARDEVTCRAGISITQQHILDLEKVFKTIGGSALTGEGDVNTMKDGLPSSFVPGRNLIFLTCAAALAYTLGITDLVGGMCQTDYSGYPDCRETTMVSGELFLTEGLGRLMTIHTPLMHLTKAEEVRLAQTLPNCMEALAYSHTCYEGTYPPCGKCPACKLRAKGFQEAGIEDPLEVRYAKERR